MVGLLWGPEPEFRSYSRCPILVENTFRGMGCPLAKLGVQYILFKVFESLAGKSTCIYMSKLNASSAVSVSCCGKPIAAHLLQPLV